MGLKPTLPLKFGTVAAYLLGFALLAAVIFVRTGGKVLSVETDRSAQGRVIVWSNASRRLLERPWLGNGPWVMYKTEPIASSDSSYVPQTMPADAKNLLLDVSIRYGLVGLGLFLTFLFGIWKSSAQTRSLLLVCAPSALVDTPFWGGADRLVSTIVLLVVLGLLLKCNEELSPQ